METGILPAATFGTQVHATSSAVLRWLRGTAAKLSPGGGQGARVATLLALHPASDPARTAVLGPIIRYAEEIWGSLTQAFEHIGTSLQANS